MKIAHTIDVGDPLAVAAFITLRVLVVNLSNSMKWLVDVTSVVNDEAEGERALVFLIFKAVLDLRDICAARNIFILQESRQIGESLHNIHVRHFKLRIVGGITTVGEIRLINEVPLALEAVALALDVIGKVCALSERVVLLIFGEACL